MLYYRYDCMYMYAHMYICIYYYCYNNYVAIYLTAIILFTVRSRVAYKQVAQYHIVLGPLSQLCVYYHTPI